MSDGGPFTGHVRRLTTNAFLFSSASNPQVTIGFVAGDQEEAIPYISLAAVKGVGHASRRHEVRHRIHLRPRVPDMGP